MQLKLRDNTTTAILINKGKRKLKLNKYFQHSTTSGTSPTLPTHYELSTALMASHSIGLILTATLREGTISLMLEVRRNRLKDIQGHTAGQCSTEPLQQPPRERIWKAMSLLFTCLKMSLFSLHIWLLLPGSIENSTLEIIFSQKTKVLHHCLLASSFAVRESVGGLTGVCSLPTVFWHFMGIYLDVGLFSPLTTWWVLSIWKLMSHSSEKCSHITSLIIPIHSFLCSLFETPIRQVLNFFNGFSNFTCSPFFLPHWDFVLISKKFPQLYIPILLTHFCFGYLIFNFQDLFLSDDWFYLHSLLASWMISYLWR